MSKNSEHVCSAQLCMPAAERFSSHHSQSLVQLISAAPAGVNINASCMLIPLGVVLYCSLGGLKVTALFGPVQKTVCRLSSSTRAEGHAQPAMQSGPATGSCPASGRQAAHPVVQRCGPIHHESDAERCNLRSWPQAAFISSYLHSTIIYVAVLLFAYTVYGAASYPLGSIDQVYQNLLIRAKVRAEPHHVRVMCCLPG